VSELSDKLDEQQKSLDEFKDSFDVWTTDVTNQFAHTAEVTQALGEGVTTNLNLIGQNQDAIGRNLELINKTATAQLQYQAYMSQRLEVSQTAIHDLQALTRTLQDEEAQTEEAVRNLQQQVALLGEHLNTISNATHEALMQQQQATETQIQTTLHRPTENAEALASLGQALDNMINRKSVRRALSSLINQALDEATLTGYIPLLAGHVPEERTASAHPGAENVTVGAVDVWGYAAPHVRRCRMEFTCNALDWLEYPRLAFSSTAFFTRLSGLGCRADGTSRTAGAGQGCRCWLNFQYDTYSLPADSEAWPLPS
jgi:hypothetical protein